MPLTDQGYIPESVTEIRDRLIDDWNTRLSSIPGAPSEPIVYAENTVLGILIDMLTDLIGSAQGDVQLIYDAVSAETAQGALLDNISALTGSVRFNAQPSTAVCQIVLSAFTTVPAEELVVGTEFGVNYRNRDILTNETASDITVNAFVTAVTAGRVAVFSGDIDQIVTPISGVQSVTNALDASSGSDREIDSLFRIRRRLELSRGGAGTEDALPVDIGDEIANPAIDVIVLSNRSPVEVDGIPVNGFEVLFNATVAQLPDDEAAQAIWNAGIPVGRRDVGNSQGEATTIAGTSQSVRFSRVDEIPLFIRVSLQVDPSWSQDDSDALAQTLANEPIDIGQDIVISQLTAVILRPDATFFQGYESRIIDVLEVGVDVTAPTGPTPNFDVPSRSIAVFDTSRIEILVTST